MLRSFAFACFGEPRRSGALQAGSTVIVSFSPFPVSSFQYLEHFVSKPFAALLSGLALAASVFLSASSLPAQAQEKAPDPDVLRVCTGSKTGNYYFAGEEIAKRLTATFKQVVLIPTGGSLDNARRLMANECDMAFVQSDVYQMFRTERPAALQALDTYKTIYTEYAQMLCPAKTGWRTIQDVARNKGRIIVGPEGTGTAETWRSLRTANPALYDPIERIPTTVDVLAASTVKDSDDTCMLWVSGLNSPDMQSANAISPNSRTGKNTLTLIDVADGAFLKIKGANGRPLYRFEEFTRREARNQNDPGMYTNLIQGWGLFGSNYTVTVPAVDAVLVSRTDYKAVIGPKSGRIVLALEDAMATIQKRINPGQ
jgi:TRAP-type uncharacterized transport system substrate-binding protein